jgi:hypothetical protein
VIAVYGSEEAQKLNIGVRFQSEATAHGMGTRNGRASLHISNLPTSRTIKGLWFGLAMSHTQDL